MGIRLSLDSIYQPVQEDLHQVEDWLKTVAKVDYNRLSELLAYSISNGGKLIRPALVLLSGKFYTYDLTTLLPMATSVELLHNATLVHDDAIDKSATRRGRPTINVTWDDDKAILLGDYLFAKAEELVSRTANVRVIRLCAETLQIITSGELNQAFNAYNVNQTYEEYIERIAAKTASLLRTTTESGAILSGAPESSIDILKNFGYNTGIAFQIIDDILDYVGTEKELGKPIGSDLSQGTLTLPALLLLQQYPDDNPVRQLFAHPDQTGQISRAIDMVRNSGIVDECYRHAVSYRDKACYSMSELPDIPSRRALLDLADFVVARRK